MFALRGNFRQLAFQRRGIQTRNLSIPVNTVSRAAILKLTNEEEAEKADAIIEKISREMKAKSPGYLGYTRMVCKSAWDYEVFFKWDSIQNLGKYMESNVRKDLASSLAELEDIAVENTVRVQNFVIDDKS